MLFLDGEAGDAKNFFRLVRWCHHDHPFSRMNIQVSVISSSTSDTLTTGGWKDSLLRPLSRCHRFGDANYDATFLWLLPPPWSRVSLMRFGMSSRLESRLGRFYLFHSTPEVRKYLLDFDWSTSLERTTFSI